ncbi:MAG: polyphosphate polymerase domain-containing protein [Flavobacteriales bacterium]
MSQISDILNSFSPISLVEMEGVELMNRTDTKFMISVVDLISILQLLPSSYRVLEVNGVRQSAYETLYYDTPDFLFYRRHHNGKKNRYKIRKRKYVESNLTFLEVKFKSNKDRTIKDRTKLGLIDEPLELNQKEFIEEETHLGLDLEAKLWNAFSRITLVNQEVPERLTIDCNLSFSQGNNHMSIEDLVICEVKQEKQNRHSPFMREVKRRLIRPDSISKYCLGVTLLYPEIKSNNFKAKILKIRKIKNGMVA